MGTLQDEALARGLRALRRLALNAPLSPDGFAALNRFGHDEATSMLEAYELSGVARRTPHGELFVLTPLGLDLLKPENPLGTLVARAVEPIEALGETLGANISLMVRQNDAMLCCVAAPGPVDPAPRPGERTPLSASLAGRVQAACDASFGSTLAFQRAGYALEPVGDVGTLAVPVFTGDRAIAVISAHFHRDRRRDPARALLPHVVLTARRLSCAVAGGDAAGAEWLH